MLLAFGTPTQADVECAAEPPVVENIQYTEAWRTDADSEEYLLGNIQAAVMDDAGALYFLDVQQQEVTRFSAAGEFLGTVARQGEGPGEINQVWSIGWWPPESIVLPQAFPAKVVRVSPEGIPQDELRILLEPDAESAASVTEFVACGDYAVVGGSTFMFSGGESSRNQWLGVAGRDGVLRYKLGERRTTMSSNPLNQIFNEFESFWSWERWAVSPSGRVFVAPERDEYVIAVYDLDGNLEEKWTRPIEARKRTADELEDMRDSRTFVFNGQKAKIDFTLSDYQPPIQSLHHFGDELWVRLDQGPDSEAYARVAVHSPDGALIAERLLHVPYDEKNDVVLMLDRKHVVVIENGVGAQAAQFSTAINEEVDEELDAEPIEVVLYRRD